MYVWTWGGGITPGSLNAGVAFSGEIDPAAAIGASAAVFSKLPGTKWISIGGGNAAGRWSQGALSKLTSYCHAKNFSGYSGVVFDVEEGDSGLSGAFGTAINACKGAGYQVLVTISHSCPYGISDGQALMRTFFTNRNIDYISPQLYSSGNEGANDYGTNGFAWSNFVGMAPKMAPSIVTGSYYADAQRYFGNIGVTCQGYVQWAQHA